MQPWEQYYSLKFGGKKQVFYLDYFFAKSRIQLENSRIKLGSSPTLTCDLSYSQASIFCFGTQPPALYICSPFKA